MAARLTGIRRKATRPGKGARRFSGLSEGGSIASPAAVNSLLPRCELECTAGSKLAQMTPKITAIFQVDENNVNIGAIGRSGITPRFEESRPGSGRQKSWHSCDLRMDENREDKPGYGLKFREKRPNYPSRTGFSTSDHRNLKIAQSSWFSRHKLVHYRPWSRAPDGKHYPRRMLSKFQPRWIVEDALVMRNDFYGIFQFVSAAPCRRHPDQK
jgi:hypothetical protein